MNETGHGILTPASARELLGAAGAGREHGDALVRRAWIGPAVSVVIGLLMGAFLLAAVYLFPTATPLEAAVLSGGYALGIVAAVTAYNLGRRVTPAGWLRRYEKGLVISCGVFFVALALSFLVGERSPALWLPLAVVTALPIALAGTRRTAR